MNHSIHSRMRYFLIAIVCLCSWTAFAQKSEVEKKIAEKYQVSSNDKLSVYNKYGDVTVNTWERNEITVDVIIKAWAKNESEAQELIDRIEIVYGKTDNEISFETKLAATKWVNINNKSGFQINYTINMPNKNSLNLSNKYGAVNLADFAGTLNLEVGYGELTAGELTGNESFITLKYSKGKIESVSKGNLEFRYSSNITIEKVGEVTLSDKYGGVTINEASKVDADIAYSSLKIGTLHQSLNLDSKYASGSVMQLKSGFSNVIVETSYGSFTLGVDGNTSFDFEVETKYGGFKSSTDVVLNKEIERHTSSSYSGTKGSGKKGKVVVNSSYGSVKFQ